MSDESIDRAYRIITTFMDAERRRKQWDGFKARADVALNKTSKNWFAGLAPGLAHHAPALEMWLDEITDAAVFGIDFGRAASQGGFFTYSPETGYQEIAPEDFYGAGEPKAG